METFGTLTTILLIVFSILNVILFIKFWMMTDNVKRILNIMEKSYCGEQEERYEIDEEADEYAKLKRMLITWGIVAVILLVVAVLIFK